MTETLPRIRHLLESALAPLVLLGIRLFMAHAFYKSWILKVRDYVNDNWEHTVSLFRDIHPVPLLPPEIAAILGTGGEVALSILLALGLLARFSAAGMIVMVLVMIASIGYYPNEHNVWLLMLGAVLAFGPGKLSLDALFFSRTNEERK